MVSTLLPGLGKDISAHVASTAQKAWYLVVAVMLCGCNIVGNDDPHTPIDGTPNGIEASELVLENGKFNASELMLPARRETTLLIVNNDDVTYYIEILLLIERTRIAPRSTTRLEIPSTALILANPPFQEFEGLLLNSRLELIDTVEVTRKPER